MTAASTRAVGVGDVWRRVARDSGYVAAGALLAGTVLFLLDATGLLGDDATYRRTSAGALADEANFWVAEFAHRHHILWDIIARDTLFPLAFVALMVLMLAVRNLVGAGRPDEQLMTLFFAVGGTVSALSDLIYLGATDDWRFTGWTAQPAARMVAVGRSSEVFDQLTRFPEAAGFVLLAAGVVCLGRVCRNAATLPARLRPLAYVEAVLLLGIAFAGVAESDTAYNIFSLLTGALVGPAVAGWLAWHLGRSRAREGAAALAP